MIAEQMIVPLSVKQLDNVNVYLMLKYTFNYSPQWKMLSVKTFRIFDWS